MLRIWGIPNSLGAFQLIRHIQPLAIYRVLFTSFFFKVCFCSGGLFLLWAERSTRNTQIWSKSQGILSSGLRFRSFTVLTMFHSVSKLLHWLSFLNISRNLFEFKIESSSSFIHKIWNNGIYKMAVIFCLFTVSKLTNMSLLHALQEFAQMHVVGCFLNSFLQRSQNFIAMKGLYQICSALFCIIFLGSLYLMERSL